jgi:hypothetical protein
MIVSASAPPQNYEQNFTCSVSSVSVLRLQMLTPMFWGSFFPQILGFLLQLKRKSEAIMSVVCLFKKTYTTQYGSGALYS